MATSTVFKKEVVRVPHVQKRLVSMQFHRPIRSGVTLNFSRDVDSIGGVDSRYGWRRRGDQT